MLRCSGAWVPVHGHVGSRVLPEVHRFVKTPYRTEDSPSACSSCGMSPSYSFSRLKWTIRVRFVRLRICDLRGLRGFHMFVVKKFPLTRTLQQALLPETPRPRSTRRKSRRTPDRSRRARAHVMEKEVERRSRGSSRPLSPPSQRPARDHVHASSTDSSPIASRSTSPG